MANRSQIVQSSECVETGHPRASLIESIRHGHGVLDVYLLPVRARKMTPLTVMAQPFWPRDDSRSLSPDLVS